MYLILHQKFFLNLQLNRTKRNEEVNYFRSQRPIARRYTVGKHRYVNYAQLGKDYAQQFELVLFYYPQGIRQAPLSREYPPKGLIAPVNAIGVSLPTAFSLIVINELQILITEKFGTLALETSMLKSGKALIQIHGGTSYREYIQSHELDKMHHWCEQVDRARG
jgi:hypothetical protein